MKGRDFTSDKYRYGFNGMEKDDEVKGSGNSYDFGARIYDSRIGRWLTVDPKSKITPSFSTYHFGKNSPIKNIDKEGEVVQGANEESFQRLNKNVQTLFKGNDALLSLFKQQEKTLQFQNIDQKDFVKAVQDIKDPDVLALANGYFESVNSTRVYSLMMVHNDKKISEESGFQQMPLSQQIGKELYDAKGNVLESDQGGRWFNDDQNTVILFNEDQVTMTEVITEKGYLTPQRTNRNAESAIARGVLTQLILRDPYGKNGGDAGLPQDRSEMAKAFGGYVFPKEELLKVQIENIANRVQKLPELSGAGTKILPDDYMSGQEAYKRPPELQIVTRSTNPRDLKTIQETKLPTK